MSLTRDQFTTVLTELLDVPKGSPDTSDLGDYIQDSIDVGELLSVLKERYAVELEPNDFRKVHTLGEVWALIGKQQPK